MRPRWLRPGASALAVGSLAVAPIMSETILQEVTPLLWVMIGISAAGAGITYGFLVYAVWKFRDKSTIRRNYG